MATISVSVWMLYGHVMWKKYRTQILVWYMFELGILALSTIFQSVELSARDREKETKNWTDEKKNNNTQPPPHPHDPPHT